MPELTQEELLLYQRAETANREVLELLGQVTQPATALHDEALALSRRLESVLALLLRSPVEADPGPPTTP